MLKTVLRVVFFTLVSLPLHGQAEAEAKPAAASPSPAGQPSAGVDLMYGSMKFPVPLLGAQDATLIGITVHGMFEVSPGLQLGGRIPIAHAQFSDDSGTGLGNLTLDMRYALASSAQSNSWIDTSLSLATAADSDEPGTAALVHTIFWVPDQGLFAPNTTTFRAQYKHHLGTATQGIELGAGLQYLSVKDGDNSVRLPFLIGGHVDLGQRAAAVGRFLTLWLIDAEDNDENFVHTLEVGLQLKQVGSGQAELTFYMPLDESYRDTFSPWGIQLRFSRAL